MSTVRISTDTDASFTTASGETVNFRDIFETVRKSVEIYGVEGGGHLSEEDLEDLFQDTVLRILKYCKSFDPAKSSARTWASRIAGNCQKDAYMDVIRRQATFSPYTAQKQNGFEYILPAVRKADGGCHADSETESSESLEQISDAIVSLNENLRNAISLRLDGHTPKEIAELTGSTPGAAATLLCRARKSLRMKLGQDFLGDYGFAA